MRGPAPLLGRVLDGKYAVESTLGRGGMGAVYQGRHLALGHPVAIKVLHPDRASDASSARRFVREAKQTFHFDDPHCVRVFDFGLAEDDLLYLVMELLEGRTLGTELAVDGALSSVRCAHVGRQIAAALACAHRLGYVHRDLKPENIMLLHHLGDPDFVKVLDFGLAKIFDEGAADVGVSIASLTQDGIVFGTPEYMSPEQAMGKPLDPRSDLYSLGVVLFEAVTGRLPFVAAKPMALLVKHVQEQAPRASAVAGARVTAALDALIAECLAKDPGDRPASADEVGERLEAIESAAAAGHAPAAAPSSKHAHHLAETAAISIHKGQPPLAGTALVAPGGELAATVAARVNDSAATMPAERLGAAPAAAAGGALPATTGGAAQSADYGAETRAVVHATFGKPRRRGWVPVFGVVAALGLAAWAMTRENASDSAVPAAGSAAVATTTGDTDPGRSAEPAELPVANAATDADADAATDAAWPGPAARPGGESAGAPPPSTGPAPATADEPAGAKPSATEARVAGLLAKAESARRRGELLGQMGAADEALRLAPKNPRAAFLVGEALIKQGDPGAGCDYLRRGRALKEARALMRSACPSD